MYLNGNQWFRPALNSCEKKKKQNKTKHFNSIRTVNNNIVKLMFPYCDFQFCWNCFFFFFFYVAEQEDEEETRQWFLVCLSQQDAISVLCHAVCSGMLPRASRAVAGWWAASLAQKATAFGNLSPSCTDPPPDQRFTAKCHFSWNWGPYLKANPCESFTAMWRKSG